ncbi:MAG: RDD family protein [Chitinophagaceae bacterium]|uniref:RDD family protein n=1 Tax=unclassified Paraflavitalea TaxID=2798305 RepID=UPI003D345A46|nr:RDD family protein [Chitinophagaceae bacterium]
MKEEYPLLTDRIQSTFIDTILIVLLMFISGSILDRYENVPDWVKISVFAGLFIVYEPVCMTFGSTLGNYLKGIRVRKDSDSTKRINLLQAIVRYPIKFFLGWISFLTIHSNPKKRAIHDLVAGSVMIKI